MNLLARRFLMSDLSDLFGMTDLCQVRFVLLHPKRRPLVPAEARGTDHPGTRWCAPRTRLRGSRDCLSYHVADQPAGIGTHPRPATKKRPPDCESLFHIPFG